MTEFMVEKVAKRLCAADMQYRLENFTEYTWQLMLEGNKNRFRSAARAAIEAMREPTEAMLDVAEDKLPLYREYDATDRKYATTWYSAVIDAALKE